LAQGGKIIGAARFVLAAGHGEGVLHFAIDGGERGVHGGDFAQHGGGGVVFRIGTIRHRKGAAGARMENRVVAEFVPFGRRSAPAGDLIGAKARLGEKEAAFQSGRIECRNGDIEVRRERIVIGQNDSGLLALRPGNTLRQSRGTQYGRYDSKYDNSLAHGSPSPFCRYPARHMRRGQIFAEFRRFGDPGEKNRRLRIIQRRVRRKRRQGALKFQITAGRPQ